MPSRRCSTSTTRRKAGEWIPNQLRRQREPRRHRLPAACSTSAVYRDTRTSRRIAEESTAWPSVSRPTYIGRPRVRPQVGHGVDARHPGLLSRRTRSTAATTTTSSRSACMYAFSENFVLPLSHDEVVHGKGSLLGQDARRRVAEVRQPPPAVRATCGRSRARSCCSWAARSGNGASGTHDRSLDWHLLGNRPITSS